MRKLRNIDTPTLVSNAYEIYAKFCPDGKIDSLNFGALQKKRITLFDFDHPENLKPYVRMLCARIIRIIERDRHRVRDNWGGSYEASIYDEWLSGKSLPMTPATHAPYQATAAWPLNENMRTKTLRQVERVNYAYATGIMKDDIIQTKTAICDRREVIYSIWVYQVLLGQKPTFTDIAEMCLRLPDAVAEGRLRGTIDALLKAGLIRRVKTGKRVFYEIVVEKVEDESHGEVLKLPAPKYILEVAREVADEQNQKISMRLDTGLSYWN